MRKTLAANLTAGLTVSLAAGVLGVAALSGCGQKGPLVLPDAPAKHRSIHRITKPANGGAKSAPAPSDPPAAPAAPETPATGPDTAPQFR